MSTRRPFVGGNWKMNLHRDEVAELTAALADRLADTGGVDVAVFPAFPYLSQAVEALKVSTVKVGAQDFYHEANGAFTGEVSLSMLSDIGCSVVLVGHSERRHVIGEPDTLLNDKVLAALEAGFEVILCVGETIEQREAGKTNVWNIGQVCMGLAGTKPEQMDRVTIAYEPVWAIGTGKTASTGDAQDAHAAIRSAVWSIHGEDVAKALRIQYGGSVKPGNAAELFAQEDIDGGLIGGAALKADDFVAIVEAAK